MPSILFVDDEPNVLAGLRRMLHGRRRQWEMSFCECGDAALDHLSKSPTDVVVSDMRMPGMDGAHLLARVQDLYPNTVRMILSGHSDQEMTLRAVGPAHRYLSKPCQPDTLVEAIESAIDLHARVVSPDVRKIIESVDTLPVLPEVYLELVEELRRPEASIESAGRIIASDLGMSAKILQLVNSSFFGLPVKITDVPHAVALLGLGVIRPLVLSTCVFEHYEEAELGGVSLASLANHSMRVATIARRIAESEKEEVGAEDSSEVYLCGLLHDVGRLVLAQAQPNAYAELCQEAEADSTSLYLMERDAFGATHGEVGGLLLQLWGLPSHLVEAVALHHEPIASPTTTFGTLTCIHAAESIIDAEATWDINYLRRVGKLERVELWTAGSEEFPH